MRTGIKEKKIGSIIERSWAVEENGFGAQIKKERDKDSCWSSKSSIQTNGKTKTRI